MHVRAGSDCGERKLTLTPGAKREVEKSGRPAYPYLIGREELLDPLQRTVEVVEVACA
jgi:hypothetical protein